MSTFLSKWGWVSWEWYDTEYSADTMCWLTRTSQVDLTLAKYTCVALQRLNGSAKKVKGEFFFGWLRVPFCHSQGSQVRCWISR